MDFLKTLGVAEFNPGACFGPGEWSETTDQGMIQSFNPATGEFSWTPGEDEQGRSSERFRGTAESSRSS
mgnify:CR=1 FL=1